MSACVIRVLLVLLASASVHSRPSSSRSAAGSLGRSARGFQRSLVSRGRDVDLRELVEATRELCAVLLKFGAYMGPSVSDVRRNLERIEEARRKWLRASPRRRQLSMKALLAAEVAAEIHGRGGVLADPSGAMGLLWVRRGLAMWADTFEQQARAMQQAAVTGEGEGSLAAHTRVAYERTVQAHHGWVSRRAFGVACRATPDWETVVRRAGLRTDKGGDEALRLELKCWAAAVRDLTEAMRSLHTDRDLEDRRKSV